MSSSRGPSPIATSGAMSSWSRSGMPSRRGQPERRADALLDEVAEVDAAQPLDDVGEHPVRRGRVVLEPRARAPTPAPTPRSCARRRSASAPSANGIAAFGKPAVCSMTCSTVIASLPWRANSGTYSATGRVDVEQPSPISSHTADATIGLVHEKMQYRVSLVGGAERLERDQLAVARDCELARRQPAALHVGARQVEQLADGAHARRELGSAASAQGEMPMRLRRLGSATSRCSSCARSRPPRARARRSRRRPRPTRPRPPRRRPRPTAQRRPPTRRATARTRPGSSRSRSRSRARAARTSSTSRPRTRARPVPLVFDFHGFGSNAVAADGLRQLQAASRPVRLPHRRPRRSGQRGGRHFSFSGEKGLQNDLTMVQSLLSHIEATLCVDASRVYATGMSDGGAMTSVLACTAPDKFAAFAAGRGDHLLRSSASRARSRSSRSPAPPIPVVPFNGGAVHCCGGTVLQSKPVVDGELGRARPLQREVHRHAARQPGRAAHVDGLRRRAARPSSTSSTAAATRGRARSRSSRSGSPRSRSTRAT